MSFLQSFRPKPSYQDIRMSLIRIYNQLRDLEDTEMRAFNDMRSKASRLSAAAAMRRAEANRAKRLAEGLRQLIKHGYVEGDKQ